MYKFENLQKIEINHTNNFLSELENCVVFIPNDNQQKITDFIYLNIQEIKKDFRKIYKQFFLYNNIVSETNLPNELKYRFPILNKFNPSYNTNQSILNSFNIPDNKRGLLVIGKDKSEFILFDFLAVDDFFQFTQDYISYLYEDDEGDFMLPSGNEDCDHNIKLDKETEEKVQSILSQLNDLKSNGKLLKVLPIVENYIKEQNLDINQLSKLEVDDDYNIYLIDYNLEIKLSHLTKSIYLLFLDYPEGILLSELSKYRTKLIDIYKEVSNRNDLDKMLTSIDAVLDIKTNAIYVHLSRIKSEFTKVLHPNIAKHYIIYGDKLKPKKISLDKNLINSTSIQISIACRSLNDLADKLFN